MVRDAGEMREPPISRARRECYSMRPAPPAWKAVELYFAGTVVLPIRMVVPGTYVYYRGTFTCSTVVLPIPVVLLAYGTVLRTTTVVPCDTVEDGIVDHHDAKGHVEHTTNTTYIIQQAAH